MPEMVRPDLKKNGPPSSTSALFSGEPDHLRDLRHLRSDLSELAAILARGLLRLTQKPPNGAVSQAIEPQKPLDVSATESPHVTGNLTPRRS